MEKTILIADDNKEFTDVLKEYLSEQEDFRVIGVANDGNETLRRIIEEKNKLYMKEDAKSRKEKKI